MSKIVRQEVMGLMIFHVRMEGSHRVILEIANATASMDIMEITVKTHLLVQLVPMVKPV